VVGGGMVILVLTLLGEEILEEDDTPDIPIRPLRVQVTGTALHTPGAASTELPPAVEREVVGVLRDYIRAASLDPLQRLAAGADEDGQARAPAPSVARLFTPAAAGQLRSADREALVDEDLPKAEHGVSTEKAEAELTALSTAAGVEVVTARISVRLLAPVDDDDELVIRRRGSLVLVPDGGSWKIDSYQIRVTRRLSSEITTNREAAFG
jgi:hypothetical protein